MAMREISLPRLLKSDGSTERWIHPIDVSLNLEITPLSYASMQLPQEESIPARSYVELFCSMGSAGIYRATTPENAYGDDTVTCELEHAISEVGDWLVTEEIKEMVNIQTAMKRVFGFYHGSAWQLGSVAALGSEDVAVNVDHDNVLESMLGILNQIQDCMMTFDFSTHPWTVAFAKRGSSVAAEGRLSRNVNSAKVKYDDSSLCTRAYYQYTSEDDDGNTENIWLSMDADTIGDYGIVERSVSTGSGYTKAEADYTARQYLSRHKKPIVSITITAEELSSVTGEAWDTFTIGKLFRLALPDYEVTIEEVISGLEWQDVYGAPESITVKLGEDEDGVISFLHDLDSSGGSKSGGRSGRGSSKANGDNYTNILRNNYAIRLEAYERVKADDWNYSYIELTANYIRNEVGQTANGLYSRIEQTASYIRAEVKNTKEGLESTITQTASTIRAEVKNTKEGLEASIKVNADSIETKVSKDGVISSINQTSESITIQASKINLSGYVTASQLKAVSADIDNLTSGVATAVSIKANGLRANDTFILKGLYVYWKEATVMLSDGTSKKLNYLGQ